MQGTWFRWAWLRRLTQCPQRRHFGGENARRTPTTAGCNATLRRYSALTVFLWRDGRVAEGARLESVYTGNRIVGSNPTPSAK
jgi:hypothetical protein